jgi:pimeloyl-ACP methyl ester carboxylesterase
MFVRNAYIKVIKQKHCCHTIFKIMTHRIANGIKLYYEIAGKGDPVVFIHGLGSSTTDWENQVPEFSRQYKTITLDLRGHGQTGGAEGAFSIKQFASDVAGLIKKENQPTHVIGISMGGMVAFQLTLDYPELVKSLVVINSESEVLMTNSKTRRLVWMRKYIPRLLGMKRMGKVLGKQLFPKKEQEHLRQLIAERWAKNSVKNYIKSISAIAGWGVKDQLYQIKCPVLVIASEFDYSSVESKKAYAEKIPNAQLVVIRDARHAVPVEKPDELNQIIFKFLTREA